MIIADDAASRRRHPGHRRVRSLYPQLFRPILRQTSISVHANFRDVLSAARGSTSHCAERATVSLDDPLKLSSR